MKRIIATIAAYGVTLAALPLSCFASTTSYYTNVSPNDSYGNPSYSAHAAPAAPPEYTGRERSHFSVEFGMDDNHIAYSADAPYTTVAVGHAYRHHRTPLKWIDRVRGEPLPPNAVIGGNQAYPRATMFICRGEYEDGLHPGKLIGGNCNISWGGP